ncbi:hypothetical protein TNCV_2068731 [Trichonephila clavipes]|uniref:Uncharacterized protein n=1 Tax=Trichonephila clavipes TaxID=2585209 RepID=A0A8X6W3A0_TRICX|nr:hypothetical protein TNCV_2068731 [Trichonephila clavipes]
MPTPVPWPFALDYVGEDLCHRQPHRDGFTNFRLGLIQVSLMARRERCHHPEENNAHIVVDMIRKDRCVLVLIHRTFHNDERTKKIPGKHFPVLNAPASCFDRSGNSCRVLNFRGFTPYKPRFICSIEYKT